MTTRGRPRHPDVLTPREWEVLDLLRADLTNEQIAERMGITADGAKYHVSQILSKLYVDNRKEAARWQPQTQRQWWRILLPLPVAAKAAGAAVIATTAIGLGAFAVLATQVDTSEDSINLTPPVGEPQLTREQVLIRVGQTPHGEPLELTVQPSTSGAILAFLEDEPAEARTDIFDADPDSTAWLVSLRGIMTQGGSGSIIGVDRAAGRTLHKRCRDVHMAFLEDDTPPAIVVGLPLPDSACSTFIMTEDMALLYAGGLLSQMVEGTAHNIEVRHVPLGQIEELGIDSPGPFADLYDAPGLVITVDGEFSADGSLAQETQGTPKCGTATMVLRESGDWVDTFTDQDPCP